MKLIAHRGLLEGPDKSIENKPETVIHAYELGFESEVDLWVVNEELFLGHDAPTYSIEEEFLHSMPMWIHAKNLDALYWLSKRNLTYFWHQEDDCVITSNGYIWTYPDKPLTDRSIRLLPEWRDPELKTVNDFVCYGICSDYVLKIRSLMPIVRT